MGNVDGAPRRVDRRRKINNCRRCREAAVFSASSRDPALSRASWGTALDGLGTTRATSCGSGKHMDPSDQTPHRDVILLVDDEQDHLIITQRFLESQGYTCLCVDRGWDALRVLGENPVDLILLDLHMPGMDGYCLAENILSHEEYRAIPIVAFSCYDLTRFKQRAMRAGMADFIPKPVDRARLLATVRDQLRLRRRLSHLSAIEDELLGEREGESLPAESPEGVIPS
jgi:CheY-like chemotaxis protein